ncbi:MAG TPA: IS1380 family transposase [Pseudonocardiaceae bacterium]|nr:IS1380 family transposase [Pseudonocardiaceae bacterium]
MHGTGWSRDLSVDIGGRDVINHAGAAVLRLLADRTGLTGGLSRALARRGFVPVHDRGRVLADTAVLIADGGRVMSDLATLRDQAELYGPIASDPTLWRTLNEIGEPQRRKISRERAKTRAHVWSLIAQRHGQIPASRVADRDLGRTIVIWMDASLVIAHSDKQLAAGTYKGSWGHHPLMAWCDNTGESLALLLRPGSAGSNTVSDHLAVLDEAIAQIPGRYRRELLITVDGAGASHGLVDHITTLNSSPWRRVHYSIGWKLGARERLAIGRVPQHAWGHVLDTEGTSRSLDEAGVVELTALLRHGPHGDQLTNWPPDLRIICRREKPHPGAQLSLFEEHDGWRYQLLATNTPATNAQFLEARHRPHARVQDNIRTGKQTGLGHLPSTSININRAWCLAATIAVDLLAWLGCSAWTDP